MEAAASTSPPTVATVPAVLVAARDAAARPAVKPGVQRFYDVLARHGAAAPFLNYGFAEERPGEIGEAADALLAEQARALYRRVLAGLPLSGARVLEAGCGRGGGALVICEEARPLRYLGLDLSGRQLALARRRLASYAGTGFVVADAEQPPVPDGGFDVAISVEAVHHFESPLAFFRAVHRALVPGGQFALAGIFAEGAPTEAELARCGFTLVEHEDLTAGVLRSLLATSARRRELVEALPLPARFGPFLLSWAGVVGSPVYRSFEQGRLRYLRYALERS
jgi:SAM-dependent methyltransferase